MYVNGGQSKNVFRPIERREVGRTALIKGHLLNILAPILESWEGSETDVSRALLNEAVPNSIREDGRKDRLVKPQYSNVKSPIAESVVGSVTEVNWVQR